jgi:molybdopterin molybdotransferase
MEEASPGKDRESDFVLIGKTVPPMENVAPSGGEVKEGEVVLKAGMVLRPGDIGLLASLGFDSTVVFRYPSVALLSTGSELVDLGRRLERGKIFASSPYLIAAQLKECGCVPLVRGVMRDDRRLIEGELRASLDADAIITTGGTLQGDSDWVRDAYARMKVDIRVEGVAMVPGRSFVFGLLSGKALFSLPGSPTACLVSFEELVRPALLKMMGRQNVTRPAITMSLMGKIRAKQGMRRYVGARVIVEDGELKAIPVEKGSRGTIRPLAQVNGLIVLPGDGREREAGEKVSVRLLGMEM